MGFFRRGMGGVHDGSIVNSFHLNEGIYGVIKGEDEAFIVVSLYRVFDKKWGRFSYGTIRRTGTWWEKRSAD